ncbi:hypothetical protein [Pseudomonas sichuanensis]|uniref:hypothetical protein n=1 Tax=Pseudomonas sichuanensis TaxID=2213015 RepID=UPI00130089B7|nr:hypothetical protein [Pseudomonas sichuanensis]
MVRWLVQGVGLGIKEWPTDGLLPVRHVGGIRPSTHKYSFRWGGYSSGWLRLCTERELSINSMKCEFRRIDRRCLLPKIGGLSVTSVGTEENIKRNNDNAWKSFAAPWNKYDDIQH